MKEQLIISRINATGKSVQVMPDGTERPMPIPPGRPMTEQERHEAAMSDPDARPMTEEQLARAKRTPRVKIMRRAMGMTQEEFARNFHLSLSVLRDWEQGRCPPDQAARAYLTVIARNPQGVMEALRSGPF